MVFLVARLAKCRTPWSVFDQAALVTVQGSCLSGLSTVSNRLDEWFVLLAADIPAPSLTLSPHLSLGTPTDNVCGQAGWIAFPGTFLVAHRNRSTVQCNQLLPESTIDLHLFAAGSNTPPGEQTFVGTLDYLASKSILGISGDDAAVDWVSRLYCAYGLNNC